MVAVPPLVQSRGQPQIPIPTAQEGGAGRRTELVFPSAVNLPVALLQKPNGCLKEPGFCFPST